MRSLKSGMVNLHEVFGNDKSKNMNELSQRHGALYYTCGLIDLCHDLRPPVFGLAPASSNNASSIRAQLLSV